MISYHTTIIDAVNEFKRSHPSPDSGCRAVPLWPPGCNPVISLSGDGPSAPLLCRRASADPEEGGHGVTALPRKLSGLPGTAAESANIMKHGRAPKVPHR